MRKFIAILAAACCLLIPTLGFGDIIADSAADFSEAQGPNWFNGLYNRTTDSDDTFSVGEFQPFAEPDYAWNGSAWDFTGGNVPWTTINATGGHPNGDNNGDVHFAIRRWVSDYDGSATVDYNIAAQNLNGGGGTTAILYLNGTELSKTTVAGTDGVGHVISQDITLASGDVLDLALSPEDHLEGTMGTGTFGDGSDGSLFGMTVQTAATGPEWQTVWQLGAPGRGWPLDGVGGGPEVDFIQERDTNPPPGNPANTGGEGAERDVDDDYYFAGTYPDAPDGVGVVETDEIAMERAFAGTDNDLRIHFNLPANLHPDDKFRFSFEANNLDSNPREENGVVVNPDPRHGVEVLVNGTVVQSEIVIHPDDLNTIFTTAEFTAGDVGLVGGPGADNILWLNGNTNNGANYSAEGGGNWMGMDYHHLEIMPIPEPGSLGMLLCGLFWAIPLVCWENKKRK